MKQLNRKKKELQLEILNYLSSKEYYTSFIKDMMRQFRTSYFNVLYCLKGLIRKGYVEKLTRWDEHEPYRISHIAWTWYKLSPKGLNYLLSKDFSAISEGLVKEHE